jgi:hypothetical protein
MSFLSGGPITGLASGYARLTSQDTGESVFFRLSPSEHDRNFGANWEEAGVAQAAPQFLEYHDSPPEERTYKVTFDAHGRGGVTADFEAEYGILKRFTLRVDGKVRAHKLIYSQGKQRFRCVLLRVSIPVRRLSKSGGAMQAIDCSITLKEIRR